MSFLGESVSNLKRGVAERGYGGAAGCVASSGTVSAVHERAVRERLGAVAVGAILARCGGTVKRETD